MEKLSALDGVLLVVESQELDVVGATIAEVSSVAMPPDWYGCITLELDSCLVAADAGSVCNK